MNNNQLDELFKKNLNNDPVARREFTLSLEDLSNPKEAILNLINNQKSNSSLLSKTKPFTKKELNWIISKTLTPTMNIIPKKNWLINYEKEEVNVFLKEQLHILDYLDEQSFAVISGGAGTGKTMIALEKARRVANENKKVLFLCYNNMLYEHLEKNYKHPNIDFFNIDKYCKHEVNVLDYGALRHKLDAVGVDLKYDAVIIDEGQDFGQTNMEESKILEIFSSIMELKEGIFYIFYDKNQKIQSEKIPSYIVDSDCKMSLYRNCRNTTNIAKTSYSVLSKNPKIIEGFKNGTRTNLYVSMLSKVSALNKALDDLFEVGFADNIVILTVKTIESSFLNKFLKNNGCYEYKGKKILFTTCKKYKGLEQDAVILIDIDKETFVNDDYKFNIYVGASRAVFKLSLILNMNREDAYEACQSINKEKLPIEDLDESYILELIMNGNIRYSDFD